jgi:hypothetical protein
MVGDLPTAEDVVQDVYASLHSRWGKVAACEAPLPYERAAVLNGCVKITSDPSGRYLLLTYGDRGGFFTRWIDHSELRFLPITQPYVEFPIPAW